MTLALPDVTICAVDSVNVALTARALRLSMERCDFGDAILFTHAPTAGPFRSVAIRPVSSTAEYSRFVFKQLPDHIRTSRVLIVQWDGHVTDPSAWRPEFLNYDYIGAKWPQVTDGMSVGNGGFSLRSHRFMQAMALDRFPLDDLVPSDWLVCRSYRPSLESEWGVRFAPAAVADTFSHETGSALQPTFGFHGMGHLERYCDDDALLDIIRGVDPYVLSTTHCLLLLLACADQERRLPFAVLYRRLDDHLGRDLLLERLRAIAGDCALTRVAGMGVGTRGGIAPGWRG